MVGRTPPSARVSPDPPLANEISAGAKLMYAI